MKTLPDLVPDTKLKLPPKGSTIKNVSGMRAWDNGNESVSPSCAALMAGAAFVQNSTLA